jgi:rod shape-determining protein MreD
VIDVILQRVHLWSLRSAPVVLTLFLVLVGAVPTHVPLLAQAMPALPLVAVFFWAVRRPDIMSPWMILAVGLFQDILLGAPLGSGPISMLVLYAAVESSRKLLTDDNVAAHWLVFFIAMALAVTALWAWSTLIDWSWLPIGPAVVLYVSALVWLAPVTWLMTQVQRAFLQRA